MCSKEIRIKGYLVGVISMIIGTVLMFVLLQQNSFTNELSNLFQMILSLLTGGLVSLIIGLWGFEKVVLKY